jgi:hypothetical protein
MKVTISTCWRSFSEKSSVPPTTFVMGHSSPGESLADDDGLLLKEGQTIRIPSHGEPGPGNGPPGIYLRVRLAAHPDFLVRFNPRNTS